MSIIRDPETYERYERVILTHGVRRASDLAYQDVILDELPNNEYFGDQVREKLIYYPTVTREPFRNQGRLTNLMAQGKLFADVGLAQPDLDRDRFMICGSPTMLKDTCRILDDWGFQESRHGIKGHYVIERAFVES
jgi:ferredoxin--NADP+ reductase